MFITLKSLPYLTLKALSSGFTSIIRVLIEEILGSLLFIYRQVCWPWVILNLKSSAKVQASYSMLAYWPYETATSWTSVFTLTASLSRNTLWLTHRPASLQESSSSNFFYKVVPFSYRIVLLLYIIQNSILSCFLTSNYFGYL